MPPGQASGGRRRPPPRTTSADRSSALAIDVGDPDGEARPVYSKADGPVVAFFKAPYRLRAPTFAGG